MPANFWEGQLKVNETQHRSPKPEPEAKNPNHPDLTGKIPAPILAESEGFRVNEYTSNTHNNPFNDPIYPS